MTEQEWLGCTDPSEMLGYLSDKASNRKLRLLACASCRHIWSWLLPSGQRAVETAERYADQLVGTGELAVALAEAAATGREMATEAGGTWSPSDVASAWAAGAAMVAAEEELEGRLAPAMRLAADAIRASKQQFEPPAAYNAAWDAQKREQSALVRDIFGNPFRSVALVPSWLTRNGGAIPRLAQAAYDERILPAGTLDPARLAVLADALEEAGCTDADMLGHLHGPGPHVRGCWVLDLLLGKE